MSDSATPQRSLASIVLRNAAWTTFGSLLLKALNFLFNVYVVRSLGDERFGQYAIVTAFPGLFAILIELGITQYVMREIARNRQSANALIWNLIAVRLLLALVGVAAITAAAGAVGYASELVFGIFLFSLSFVLSALETPLEVVLAANERFDYLALLNVVGRVSFMSLGALFLWLGLSFHWLIAAGLIGLPIQMAVAIWAVRKHRFMEFRPTFAVSIWPGLIRAGVPFGMISLALTVAFSIDSVMLSLFESDSVVGWYKAAYDLVFSLMFVFGGLSTVMVPTLSREYASNPDRVHDWYHRSVRMILLMSAPMAVGGMMVAYPLIEFLYGREFLPSALALQILIWDVPLLMFNAYCGNMTTVTGQERAAARIYGLNAVANIVLNLYAIPRFGIIGASLVTVITDLIGALQFNFLLKRKLQMPSVTALALRVGLASTLMGVVVWLANSLPLVVQIFTGMAAYGILALVLRLIGPQEKALMLRLWQRVSRRPVVSASS
ncbi:MAG: flippase [Anaerolineales bacterium]